MDTYNILMSRAGDVDIMFSSTRQEYRIRAKHPNENKYHYTADKVEALRVFKAWWQSVKECNIT